MSMNAMQAQLVIKQKANEMINTLNKEWVKLAVKDFILEELILENILGEI
jgi:hypothetical protein